VTMDCPCETWQAVRVAEPGGPVRLALGADGKTGRQRHVQCAVGRPGRQEDAGVSAAAQPV